MIGKCLCGRVEFKISGSVPNLYQCHCSQCRRQGGSSSNSATIVKENQFSWESGQDLVTQFKDKTGFSSHFCSACGSPVPNKVGSHELVWIPAGLLEDGEGLDVVVHLYVGSKASWDQIPESGMKFEEMPSLEVLTQALERTSF